MKFSTIFWIVIIALGLTLFVIGSNDGGQIGEISPTPTISITPTPTNKPQTTQKPDGQSFDGFPDQSLVQDAPDHTLITGPGSCSLSGGKIVFSEPNVAVHENATLTYNNIDHPGRLIFWSTSPNDGDLVIGPNLFSGQQLPGGTTNVTVVIDKNNPVKEYKVFAKISYGVLDKDGGVLRVETADCSGDITVELSYL